MANKKVTVLAIDDNRDNLITLKALINEKYTEASILYRTKRKTRA